MYFSKKGHLIASAYNRVCIDLIKYDFSKTFFQFKMAYHKIQSDALVLLDDFQNHDILFKFI